MRFILIALTMAIALKSSQAGPIHASCNLDWSWPSTDCVTIQNKILAQIDLWTTDSNCPNGAGEKCLYKTKSKTDTQILATHTTPKKGYVDDLTFTFKPNGNGCNVHVCKRFF